MGIEAVIFDLGGVLLAGGEPQARQAWEARLGLAAGGLDRALADAIGPGWEGGRSEEDIHHRLADRLGIEVLEVPGLLSDLQGDSHLDPGLTGFIRGERPRRRIAILANNGPDVRPGLNARFGLEDLVDLVVISGEEGVAKPDPAIYRITAERLGVRPDQCVFVDDRPENVEGAEAAGMIGVVHRETPSTLGNLDRLLAAPAAGPR